MPEASGGQIQRSDIDVAWVANRPSSAVVRLGALAGPTAGASRSHGWHPDSRHRRPGPDRWKCPTGRPRPEPAEGTRATPRAEPRARAALPSAAREAARVDGLVRGALHRDPDGTRWQYWPVVTTAGSVHIRVPGPPSRPGRTVNPGRRRAFGPPEARTDTRRLRASSARSCAASWCENEVLAPCKVSLPPRRPPTSDTERSSRRYGAAQQMSLTDQQRIASKSALHRSSWRAASSRREQRPQQSHLGRQL
jgi:hypothetical protein